MAECEVKLNLDKVIEKLLPEAIVKGLELGSQVVENDAKRNAPVNDGVLRASITHEVDKENGMAVIGSNVEYAPYVHFGTGIYAENGRQTPWMYTTADGKTYTTVGQKPNPFLQDAIDSNMDNIIKQFENLLDGEM